MSTDDTTAAHAPAGQERTSDPERIRALAHPLRLALLDYLDSVGEATATQCAKHTGETVANCSFHLRLLARYGFVEPAERRGRERPWRHVEARQLFTPDESVPGSVHAVVEFAEIAVRQEADRFVDFLRARADRTELAGQRPAVAMLRESYWATPDEADRINEAVTALIEPLLARSSDPSSRPAGARLMRWFSTSHPDLGYPEAPGPEASDAPKLNSHNSPEEA
ncbi:helix-turn-helix domain-containing protein [Cellulomonas sp. URHE0023]|uniref:winged helix-turn-helix domain-containing protein n=1 Tax=Cellulomonas sp. URHE0023 TaxID=1380354 RepID=UPI0012DEDF80|nr:helix-turn-helix domain-containing protein [Cellulomonas sp. URHE0023]